MTRYTWRECEPSLTDPSGSVLITVEEKQGNQRILTEQIARQVRAAFESTSNNLIVPTAIAAIRGKGMYVVEFKAVHRDDIATFEAPVVHREAVFCFSRPFKEYENPPAADNGLPVALGDHRGFLR